MKKTYIPGMKLVSRVLVSVGFVLICLNPVTPPPSLSALTSTMDARQADEYSFAMEQAGIKTRAAFSTADARNLCVRVINSGSQEMTVWLLQSQSVVGLFTVLPHRISAMCTVANKIELGCSGDSCESTWAVFDEP